MKAVVMAGGEGSRLRPLTLRCPKPLVPIANKPVMHHILDLLKRHGITEVVVTLHYLADQIVAAFGDGSHLGMSIRYTVEETPLGTAGSVKQAEEWLKDEPFLIISGDSLTDIDLTKFIEFHRSKNAEVTLALVEQSNPLDYGVVVTKPDGHIERFLEKPDWTEAFSNTINTGIYCLDPVVFSYMDQGIQYDWSHDVFPRMLADGRKMYGEHIEGYWCDVGSHSAYKSSQVDCLKGTAEVVNPGTRGQGDSWLGDDVIIEAGAIIRGPVLIGSGSHIKRNAVIEECSVIGDHCVIESGARIIGSTLWNGVYVGQNAQVEGAVICRNSTIARGSRLEEGTIIGERAQIQRDSWLSSDVKVWPDKVVEAGTRLTMSLVSGARYSGALFDEGAVRGIPNIEITPEFTTKLASAYGSTLAAGSSVLVGRDSHPASRMIKRALLSGLMSSGIQIIDVHAAHEPMSRYLTRNSSAIGGIHIHMSTTRPSLVTLDFFDENGIALSKNAQRKVENLFGREDYRRVDGADVGQIHVLEDAVSQYRQALRRHVDRDLFRENSRRILLDCAHGTIAGIAPVLLGELGVRPVTINAYPDPSAEPRTEKERTRLLNDLSAMVQTLGADLGALLAEDASALHVVDGKGRMLSRHVLLMVMAELVFRTESSGLIVAPTAAPSELEEVAEREGGSIVRSRNNSRAIITDSMTSLATLGADTHGRFVFPRVNGAFDGVAALLDMMQRLARLEMKLSEIVDELPNIYIGQKTVACSWERKGEIIRRLGEEIKGADLDEGVRLSNSNEWVHILPDAATPVFHVHAQAKDANRLNELLEDYSGKLQALESSEMSTV